MRLTCRMVLVWRSRLDASQSHDGECTMAPVRAMVPVRPVLRRSGIIRVDMGLREGFGHYGPLSAPLSPNAPG
jgi:hypothetical protein